MSKSNERLQELLVRYHKLISLKDEKYRLLRLHFIYIMRNALSLGESFDSEMDSIKLYCNLCVGLNCLWDDYLSCDVLPLIKFLEFQGSNCAFLGIIGTRDKRFLLPIDEIQELIGSIINNFPECEINTKRAD